MTHRARRKKEKIRKREAALYELFGVWVKDPENGRMTIEAEGDGGD